MRKNAILVKRIVRALGLIILVGLVVRILIPWFKVEPVILTKSEGVIAAVALLFSLATNKSIEILISLVEKFPIKNNKNNDL